MFNKRASTSGSSSKGNSRINLSSTSGPSTSSVTPNINTIITNNVCAYGKIPHSTEDVIQIQYPQIKIQDNAKLLPKYTSGGIN